MKSIVRFFDKLEDRIRGALSRRPIIYALVGAVGIILVWKGIWESAEYFPALYGPVSIILGVAILLLTGLLVSFFIGDSILISGWKHEKKLFEKTEDEMRGEEGKMDVIMAELAHIEEDLAELKEKRIEE